MNLFDKITAISACILAIILIPFGFLGIFLPIKLWAALPPVISSIWLFVGIGILRAVYIAWNGSATRTAVREKVSPYVSGDSPYEREAQPYPEFLADDGR